MQTEMSWTLLGEAGWLCLHIVWECQYEQKGVPRKCGHESQDEIWYFCLACHCGEDFR